MQYRRTATASLLATFCAGTAHAQDASAPTPPAPIPATAPANVGVTDIIVTAQRRSENLQRVPIAVSAVTATQLTTQGVTGLINIQVAVPGLSVQNVAGYLGLHLRGVGSIANGPGFENPIALYVDGVYYANQSFGLAGFNNIERIEVLKGPQGTLFGRNATGGLVQIITRDPGRTVVANGSLEYGNFNSVEAKLYTGGPVSDTLSADIALRYARHDGWGTNLFNGKDVYALKHDVGVRSKVIWKPGNFQFTLIGDYSDRTDNLTALRSSVGSTVIPGVGASSYPGKWDVNSNVQPLLRTHGGGVSLKGQVDIGIATLSDIVAWRETRFHSEFDFDGSPLPLSGVVIDQKDRQFSNEFQIASNSSTELTWVAGLFYFTARGQAEPIQVNSATTPALNPGFPVVAAVINGLQDTRSVAGYAQATYKLTDRLSLTGGARYSWERRSLDSRIDLDLLLPGNPVIPAVPDTRNKITFKRPSFRAAVDYRLTNDVLLYATFNTGFKSGGFNVTIPTDPAYLPEKLKSYEVGEKADLFDRRMRLNTALFYYDYKDLQVQIPELVGTGFTNGASATIYGADVDLTVVPTSRLEIRGSMTLLHAKFKDFRNAPISALAGGVPTTLGDVSGNRLAYTPKLASSISATYTVPVGTNELVVNGGWLHSSSFFFEPDNVVRQHGYDQFNAEISYKIDKGRYTLSAFGNNLSNVVVRSLVLSTPSGPRIEVLQPPRTYGVRASFAF